LFSLFALEDLELGLAVLRDLDDAWLRDTAGAWPSIKRISLSIHTGEMSKMTLTGLIPLIMKNPQLESLHLPLNTKIRRLVLNEPPINDPQVFRSLVRLFPNLQLVEYGEKESAFLEVNRHLGSTEMEDQAVVAPPPTTSVI
jgi:hypothetical protein